MSNQRRGNWKPAAMSDVERINTMAVAKLMSDCAKATDGDVSFYFEQVADYFREHYSPKKGLDTSERELGQ